VPGQLADTNTVIVDVGTGFYVEKSTAEAIKFYNGKVDDLSKNLGDLEKVVQGKNENLRIVEEGQSVTHNRSSWLQESTEFWDIC
jgi:prefoldin alpha subunit